MCLKGLRVYLSVHSDDTINKDTLKKRIKELGGAVILTIAECEVIVYHKGSQATLDIAKSHNLPVVTPSWVDGCHKTGVRQDFASYLRQEVMPSQTPPQPSLPIAQKKATPAKSEKSAPPAAVEKETKTKSEQPRKREKAVKDSSSVRHIVCIGGDEKVTLTEIAVKLGASSVEDPFTAVIPPTVLVVDSSKRTVKVLWALANNVPIVMHDWLLQSLCEESPTSITPYLTKASKANQEARKGKSGALLQSTRVALHGTFTCPTRKELTALIEALGGSVAEGMNTDESIVICPTDSTTLPRAQRASVSVVRQMWLHDSIEAHVLKLYELYQFAVGSPETAESGSEHEVDGDDSASVSSVASEESPSQNSSDNEAEADSPAKKKQTVSGKASKVPRQAPKPTKPSKKERAVSPVKHSSVPKSKKTKCK